MKKQKINKTRVEIFKSMGGNIPGGNFLEPFSSLFFFKKWSTNITRLSIKRYTLKS